MQKKLEEVMRKFRDEKDKGKENSGKEYTEEQHVIRASKSIYVLNNCREQLLEKTEESY